MKKRKTDLSPKTIAQVKKWGGISDRCDRFINIPGMASPIHKDLFGFGDRIALIQGWHITAIQLTSMANMAARWRKILADPKVFDAAARWMKSGGWIEIWGWAKRGLEGQRKLWTLKRWRLVLHPDDSMTYEEVASG